MKTSITANKSLSAIAALSFALTAPSQADLFEWDWDGKGASDNGAGNPSNVRATFDSQSNAFTYTASFDQLVNGMTLVVSPGPNPKGTPDELSVIYMNANEEIASYVYSGRNDSRSNVDPGIVIEDSLDRSWINSISVVDLGDNRTFRFDIDATTINGFGDSLTPPSDDWTGMAFGEELGIWFHWWDDANTDFENGLPTADWGKGEIVRNYFGDDNGRYSATARHRDYYGNNQYCDHRLDPKQGWLDLSHQETIPEPNSAFLVALASTLIILRRQVRASRRL